MDTNDPVPNVPLAAIISNQIRLHRDLLADDFEVSRVGNLTVRHYIGALITQVVFAAFSKIEQAGDKVRRIHGSWSDGPHPILTVIVDCTDDSFADTTSFSHLQEAAQELRGSLAVRSREICLNIPLH